MEQPIFEITDQINSKYHGQKLIITQIYEDKIVIFCMPSVICKKNNEGKLICKYEGTNVKDDKNLTENHDDLTEAIESCYAISPPQGVVGVIEDLWDELEKNNMDKDQFEKQIHELWDWVNKNSKNIY